MKNSHGTSLKQVTGNGQECLTHTHTCKLFFIKGLYHEDCNVKPASEGAVLCFIFIVFSPAPQCPPSAVSGQSLPFASVIPHSDQRPVQTWL